LQVIPPAEWVARLSGYENIDITIPAPIKQEVCFEYGAKGAYKVINIAKKSMTVQEYEKLANSNK
jgi:jumonji domain-containing protein 2